jgi:type VI secretion system secreted protein VgrG
MGKTTQKGRLLSINTPLGEDFLLLRKMSATEGLSQLFTINVELLHEEDKGVGKVTLVEPESILGKAVTISVTQNDDEKRFFSGIVSRFSQGNRSTHYSYYYATIVPHVWILTQNIQSRIFQHISVPDILRKIFADFEVLYEIQGDFKPRNYCVQYRESDFDFASRLMEEEGIYYYFIHEGGKDKMILANTPQSHRDCPNKSELPYFVEELSDQVWVNSIMTWQMDYTLQSGKVTHWDYNFQLPTQKLDGEQPSRFNVGGNQMMEVYDYPGGYARKYDGIDKSGGEQASNLQNVYPDKDKTLQIRMEALDAQFKISKASSLCSTITAGHRFKLNNHPSGGDLNTQYVIVSATHEAEQTPDYISELEVARAYENGFSCIPHGAGTPVYRPPVKTPKPIIYGTQTAVVVGPAGEEIFTDKYGRVKVQFNWDREGKIDANSSCWIRVTQSWASNKWGVMFIPRIGMEVLVTFLDGDPDQPAITGCVYNPETMPPYTLPDEKTKSTIKSNSSKGGNGFNEFRIEDKKGEEQIFIHAEKDQDIRVKNDCKEIIKHDRHLIIENEQFEKVLKDKHLKVVGDHNEQVDGTISIKAGVDLQEKVGTNYALDAGMAVHIKAGMSAVIEAGASLTLKVGGNFVSINPGGVQISGTMVMINSGGAAGSGAGCSPDPPKDPKEAANAVAGQKVNPRNPPPPPNPPNRSAWTNSMMAAAASGAPFVA